VILNIKANRFEYISVKEDTIMYDRVMNKYYVLGLSEHNPYFKEASRDSLTSFYESSVQFHKLEKFGEDYSQ